MTTKVNDSFEFYRDDTAWHLIEWKEGRDKDGNSKRQRSETFYSSLIQVCSAILDRSAGKATEAKSVIECIESAKNDLFNAIYGGGWKK